VNQGLCAFSCTIILNSYFSFVCVHVIAAEFNVHILTFRKTLRDNFERNVNKTASAGNRTRAARVAGEHSTTEPPMLTLHSGRGSGLVCVMHNRGRWCMRGERGKRWPSRREE
jgi:hypothetical protein